MFSRAVVTHRLHRSAIEIVDFFVHISPKGVEKNACDAVGVFFWIGVGFWYFFLCCFHCFEK